MSLKSIVAMRCIYLENKIDSQYYKAYIAGYRDGIADAYRGTVKSHNANDPTNIPVTALGLSTRACNCLAQAHCQTVADVLSLEEYAVQTMRNLGRKTAAEIALRLAEHHCLNSVWALYL